MTKAVQRRIRGQISKESNTIKLVCFFLGATFHIFDFKVSGFFPSRSMLANVKSLAWVGFSLGEGSTVEGLTLNVTEVKICLDFHIKPILNWIKLRRPPYGVRGVRSQDNMVLTRFIQIR